jgi:uncharacterized protein (DUF433 family)
MTKATIDCDLKVLPGAVTPVEAAWITGVSPKTINATIDRGEVKPCARQSRSKNAPRLIGAPEVVYLVLRRKAGSELSPKARRELYARLNKITTWTRLLSSSAGSSSDFEISLAGGIVKVEVKYACREVAKRWMALSDASRLVISDPEIRGGEPVIKGTRIPVFLLAQLVDQGASPREILEDYPSLTADRLRAAIAYVRTNPRRGRPRKAPWRD